MFRYLLEVIIAWRLLTCHAITPPFHYASLLRILIILSIFLHWPLIGCHLYYCHLLAITLRLPLVLVVTLSAIIRLPVITFIIAHVIIIFITYYRLFILMLLVIFISCCYAYSLLRFSSFSLPLRHIFLQYY